MIYFTSDWHFNHNKEFIYEPRGFFSVDEMNSVIIHRYNALVNMDDIVYVLGDLSLGGASDEALKKSKRLIQSLKGELRVILGNHDTDRRIEMYKECWNVEVIGFAERLKVNGYNFYLSHYPSITSNLDFDKPLKSRVINLFGHTHSKDKFYEDNPLMYNVSIDAQECLPVSVDKVIKDIKKKIDG